MVSTADALKVGITVDDKTKQGLNSAKKNVSSFEKGIKDLAKTLGVAFSADKLVDFAKTSVKAFLEDEAAAAKLSNTVKNLGYGFATGYVSDYIGKLEKTAAVADDELRPAFQTLIQQTGSLTQAQSLLATAIETSRGSGESLSTVSNDLAQAYVGNVKGLKKYYLGLDAATLKTKSFAEVQQLLNQQFSGANEAYLNTYAGQVGALGLAWQNFQEKAGGSILMLASLGEGSNAQGLSNFSKLLDLIASGFDKIAKGATSVLALFNLFGKNKGILGLFNPAPGSSPLAPLANQDQTTSYDDFLAKYKKMLADIEKQNKKDRDAAAAAAKKLTAEQKKQALLKKQSTLTDMEQIQLVAALKNQLSKEEENRVKLQLALLQGNEDEAKRLSTEIANSIDKTGNLAKYLQTLPDANNPFKNWDGYLKSIQAQVDALNKTNPKLPTTETPSPVNAPATNAQDFSGFALPTTMPGTAGSAAQFGSSTPWAQAVNVYIDGKQLTDAVQNQALNGNTTFINRSVGAFDR